MAQRIVISEFMDAPAVESLRAGFDVEYGPQLVDDPPALAAALANADAWIVRNRTQVRGAALAAAAKVRVVGRLGVGLDNIDLEACKARGIEVIPATGANAESVAEYVVTMALVLLRGAYHATPAVAAGKWPRAKLSEGREAKGKVLGLVGYGSIGRITAEKATALGMRVVTHDPVVASPNARTLEALLAESDVVSLHMPLTPQTRGLLDAGRLALMKPDAVLINTARGGVLDEATLAAALKAGKLGGAALDVFDTEPLAAGSPLADAPNLVLTPHIAGVSKESNERVSSLIAERVADFLRR